MPRRLFLQSFQLYQVVLYQEAQHPLHQAQHPFHQTQHPLQHPLDQIEHLDPQDHADANTALISLSLD